MRLFKALLYILTRMKQEHRFIFTMPSQWMWVANWDESSKLSVGPQEDPHTYPSLQELAFYQADEIMKHDHQVWLLFPVPKEVYLPIMQEAIREHFDSQ